MTKIKNQFTRRDFIKSASFTAMGMAMGLPAVAGEIIKDDPLSKVVLIRNKNVVDLSGKINADILSQMLDEAVTTLFDKENPVDCWKQIIKPDDIVGVKSNEWGPLPTPNELEQTIHSRLVSAGVKEKNISIDDRGIRYDPIFQNATALINVRPFRTHAWSGVGSLLKNYIMFVPEPSEYHPNSCASLGAIWHLPVVRNKTRLNILVLLTPLFYGVGPHHFDTTYVWPYGGLLVGTDPVAVDTIGLRLFQLKRKKFFGKDSPIRPRAHHIAYADQKYNLGTSDLRKIDLIKLGWQDGVLL